jgi:hypothetical protein
VITQIGHTRIGARVRARSATGRFVALRPEPELGPPISQIHAPIAPALVVAMATVEHTPPRPLFRRMLAILAACWLETVRCGTVCFPWQLA